MAILLIIVLNKAIAWLPIAIGAAALGGIASSIFGTHSTNKTNALIATKTNKFNAEQNDLAWQREQEAWNKENEYNTPANQVARLQAAGLSPYLAYSNMSSGNAGSLNVPSPVSAAGYSYNSPLNALSTMFGSILPSVLATLSGVEDLKQKQVDTQYAQATLPARIGTAQNDLALSQWQLNNNEYISRMNQLRAMIMDKYGMSNADFESQLLSSRAAASTYDKMIAQARYGLLSNELYHSNLGKAYENQFGYNGREDLFGAIERSGSTGGAILRAVMSLGKSSGLDARLINIIRSLF